MPNWITNKVQAGERVIRGMMNKSGNIDFSTLLPFPGQPIGDVPMDAEGLAESVCRIREENPLSTEGGEG